MCSGVYYSQFGGYSRSGSQCGVYAYGVGSTVSNYYWFLGRTYVEFHIQYLVVIQFMIRIVVHMLATCSSLFRTPDGLLVITLNGVTYARFGWVPAMVHIAVHVHALYPSSLQS